MKNIIDWIDEATRPILLKKDRQQAARELADHFEDRRAALRARGVSPDQAEQDALAAMGDAKETGRLLRKAYQPVLSVFLLLSKAALVLACLLLLSTLVLEQAGIISFPNFRSNYPYQNTESYRNLFYPNELHAWRHSVLKRGSVSESIRIGLYRIRAEEAVAGFNGITSSNSDHETAYITVLLRADRPLSLSSPDNLFYYLEARDNLGNTYPNASSMLPQPAGYPQTHVSGYASTFGRDYLQVNISGPASLDLTDLEWIDLIYDHAGKQFTIRVELTEEMS